MSTISPAVLYISLVIPSITVLCWIYLMTNRSWPPLATKSLPALGLVALSTFAHAGGLILESYEPPLISWCEVTFDIYLFGASIISSAVYVRLHRYYSILVKHNPKLWSFSLHMLLINFLFMSPRLIVYIAIFGVSPEVQTWQGVGNCGETAFADDLTAFSDSGFAAAFQSVWSNRIVLTYVVLMGVVVRTLFFGIKLRNVRSQFNEWNSTLTAIIMMFASIGLGYAIYGTTAHVVWAFHIGPIIFWLWMWSPFYHLIKGDEEYLYKYTYGFSTVPSPEDLKAKLEDQLSLPEVREKFRQFAGKRFAVENLEFYEDVLELEELIGWFERQAKVMSIIDLYIRNGSDKEINISDRQKKAILNGNLNDYALFENAKKEVISLMETDLAPEFQETDEMKKLAAESQAEADELAALAASGLMGNVAKDRSQSRKRSESIGSPAARAAKPPGLAPAPPAIPDPTPADAPEVPDLPGSASE